MLLAPSCVAFCIVILANESNKHEIWLSGFKPEGDIMLPVPKLFYKSILMVLIGCLLFGGSTAAAIDFDNSWQQGFYTNGLDGQANALCNYGGNIIIGGSFAHAAALPAASIVGWNPITEEFFSLADGFVGYVRALTLFEGDLIATGHLQFSGDIPLQNVARWDGTQWTTMGEGLTSSTGNLQVYNGQLYADQYRWTGHEWVDNIPINGSVYCLEVWNDELIIGGSFTEAGGVAVERICSWDGVEVKSLGAGLNSDVQELLVKDDNLIAGGRFTASGETELDGLGTWNGSAWSNIEMEVDPNFQTEILALCDYQGDLVVSSTVTNFFEGSYHLFRQVDSNWETLADLDYGRAETLLTVGGDLFIGGRFGSFGGIPATNLARYSVDQCHALASGGQGLGFSLASLCTFQGQVITGGYFRYAGSTWTPAAAAWDGNSWNQMSGLVLNGESVDPIPYSYFDKLVTDDTILVGGLSFVSGCLEERYVCQWDPINNAWMTLVPDYRELAVLDGQIYGTQNRINGVYQVVDNSWTRIPGDFFDLHSGVTCLETWNGMLIAGGYFNKVDDLVVNCIAAWNGEQWLALGDGLPGGVKTIGVFNNTLVAVYYFESQLRVAMLNGEQWQTLGGTFSNGVHSLQQYGTHLFAGGYFHTVDGRPASGLAWWNGYSWNAFGNTEQTVHSLTVNDGKLYLAGTFRQLGSVTSARFACLPEPLDPLSSSDDFLQIEMSLGPNAPNPFNPLTTLNFSLPVADSIQLEVYDLRGLRVDTVVQGYYSAGNHSVLWDGKDAQGQAVASGTYFARLSNTKHAVTRKIMLVR